MNEFNFNTEENFIQPSGRKNLEQLFDVEIQPVTGDDSLRYVPPKKFNNEKSTEPETRFLWQTLVAKVVFGFKNGESVGRVGMAILRNIDNDHRIIVYKSKANMLATLTIENSTRHRTYLHRQKCYWQFYDDAKEFWSLLFERSTDETEFVNKLQDCGIKMHLDVNLKPESVMTTEELQKQETVRIERPEKMQDITETKRVRIKEADNTKQLINEEKISYESGRNSQRENLLSRLPKMGGQQLPQLNESNLTSNTSTTEDSSDDNGSSLTIVGQPIYPCTQLRTQIMFPVNQATSAGSSSNNLVMQPLETQVMQMMLVENRTQNTELRINMDKLEGKLEKVLEKIDNIHNGQKQEDEIIRLEEQILELKKENRRLKNEYRDVAERSDTSINQIWKIFEIELRNLGLSVEANTTHDIETLVGELLDKVTHQRNQLKEKDSQLKSTLINVKEINDRYQQEKKLHNETIEKLEHTLKKIKSLQATLEEKMIIETELNERINELKSKHGNEITNVKLEMTQAVKDIMNTLYHNLAKNIVDMDKLVPEEVLALIGKTIRQDTLAAVAKISK